MTTTQNSPMYSATSDTSQPQTAPNQSQPPDSQKIISWANSQYMRMKQNRWKEERQWYLNLSFYFGRQNVIFQQSANQPNQNFKLYTPPAPYYRSRPIINLVRPRLRREMSQLTSQKPNAFIIPASSDDRDMYAAQAGENIWDYLYRDKKVPATVRRAIFWTSVTGNGFIKCWWDENKPDYFSDQNGDICYESVPPFNLFVPDLKEQEIENQPYVIHASLRSAEQLSLLFGSELKFNKTSDSSDLESSFMNAMGIQNYEKSGNILVLECWVKPGNNKMFPKGAMFTVAGNNLVEFYEGWPYAHGKYPFAHIGLIETGKFYCDSTLVDLIGLQRAYNKLRGQIIESRDRMAKPQLAAEIGSLDPGKITSEPGQVVMYRPGFNAPQPIPLQSLPSYVLQDQETIKTDMDEISGQHEVSRGEVPPGVTAASAISFLQEQDQSQLSYTYDSIEEAFEKIAYESLNYVKQYWNTQRKVKVTGSDGSFDVLTFEGSDLRDNTDIRVEAGSALPVSRAAKQAFIMDLMKFGFIDPQKGLEVMEIGGINKIYEQIQIDIRQAQRENLKMAQVTDQLVQTSYQEEVSKYMQSPEAQQLASQGLLMEGPKGDLVDLSPAVQGLEPEPVAIPLIVPVNTWDDHRTHINRHNNYRKTQSYDELSQAAKNLFEDHVKQHVEALMIGAAGALPPGTLTPDQMDMSQGNQEAAKLMDQQAPPEDQMQTPSPTGQ